MKAGPVEKLSLLPRTWDHQEEVLSMLDSSEAVKGSIWHRLAWEKSQALGHSVTLYLSVIVIIIGERCPTGEGNELWSSFNCVDLKSTGAKMLRKKLVLPQVLRRISHPAYKCFLDVMV